jgi:hypothetical protein
MDFADYQAIDACNWTTLKEVRRSLKHYQWRLSHPLEDSTTLALGRAAHTAIFEPDRFPVDYAVFGGKRRQGKEWDAFEAANIHRTILRLDEYAACLSMRDAVRAHPVAAEYLKAGKPEHTITWTDEETGIACKGRIDWLSPIALVDLKTTNDLDPQRFAANAARMGYHCQLAWYGMGLRARGLDLPAKLLAVETTEPHDVIVFSLDEDTLYAGEQEVRDLLSRVAAGRFSQQWPGRAQEETPLALPSWAFPADEDDVAGLGLMIAQEG